jgi:flavin reductase (DIM6/NTAB) family NADH-FMN oxidoreductase RutF
MTIGWGTIGSIWARPMFIVLVRHSRYSFSLMEQVSDFTVNVLPRELAADASLCGTVSGREHDKFQEAHLTPVPSREVRSPIIKECVVRYPMHWCRACVSSSSKKGDFHRIYFGEIVASYADEDATRRLSVQGQGSPTSLP